MASTIANYQGNGSTTDFSVPFDYLAKKFVKVTVDSLEKLGGDYGDTTKDYFFVDKTTIRFNTAPASGTEIIIRRYTSATDRIVSFKDASVLKAKDLDVSTIQTIHIAEEGRDIINDALIVDKEGNWDAKGKRIINVGDPIEDNDAITLKFYKDDAMGAYQAKLDAEAARDAAKVSETNAKASEVEAKKQADLAKGYAEQAASGQINSDWAETSATSKAFIKNKPTLGALASKDSIAYSEITGTPPEQDLSGLATKNELQTGLASKANTKHTHTVAEITNLNSTLSGYVTTATLTTELAKKANASHTHTTAQVTGLDTALAGKAPTSHTHTSAQITDLTTKLNAKLDVATFNGYIDYGDLGS